MDDADKKIKKKSRSDLKKESDAVKQGEISDIMHSIKTKLLDCINERIVGIVLIVIIASITIAVYGFWLWLNVTENPTECVKTVSQARWDDYKYIIDLVKSSTIVALFAIMWKHKNKQ